MLSKYFETSMETQICMDECARGSLFGPVYAAAVIWDVTNEDDEMLCKIKDSKKMSRKKRNELVKFIETNCIEYCVKRVEHDKIDEINILNATYEAMHECVAEINNRVKIDRIVVDGNRFKPYVGLDGLQIKHDCVVKGDDKYIGIAAASILAKTYHDDWIDYICDVNPDLHEKYKLKNNMGYGTKDHMKGLETYGLTEYHRKSFCKRFLS
jgi:ribonuclease HII